MVTTQQSLKELNQHLRKPVKMRNMRPNIVVDGQRSFDEVSFQRDYLSRQKAGGGAASARAPKLEQCVQTERYLSVEAFLHLTFLSSLYVS